MFSTDSPGLLSIWHQTKFKPIKPEGSILFFWTASMMSKQRFYLILQHFYLFKHIKLGFNDVTGFISEKKLKNFYAKNKES